MQFTPLRLCFESGSCTTLLPRLCPFDTGVKSLLSRCSVAEYYTLCPGGEGFRPNPITIILEGECTSNCHPDLNKRSRKAGRKVNVEQSNQDYFAK